MRKAELDCLQPLFPGGVVTIFQGKTREYCIERHTTPNGKDLTDMPGYSRLIEDVTGEYLEIYPNRDRGISIERMRKSLSYPRTILDLAIYQDELIGFGIFPRLTIFGESVVYSTRAFEKDHEGEGLGTHVLSEAIQLHQEEVAKGHRSIRYGALMTQNPVSVLTLRRIPSIETIFPFSALYNTDPSARHIMLGVHNVVMLNSQNIDTNTGVSRRELKEIGMNETYRPDPEQKEASEIHQKMVDEFGMNREAGDVVYVTFRLKRPNNVASIPLHQAA